MKSAATTMGVVSHLNPARTVMAVLLSSGAYAVLTLRGISHVELGDVICGPLAVVGPQQLRNLTRSEALDVEVKPVEQTIKGVWKHFGRE